MIEAIVGPRVAAEPLRVFAERLLSAAGADRPSAVGTARAVVDASARAFDTHGIRLLPYYLKTLEGGRVNGTPVITATRKAAAALHLDADDGFGHAPSYAAIDSACDLAAATGIAVATVGRSSHHGATGCYTWAAAQRGFAAIGMTHADPVVVPHGGTEGFFGTNPLSFAVPVPGEDPLLLDMATSSIPFNRVLLRQATGTPLPPDVALTAEGVPTTDPAAAAALMPLGGQAFGYKGAGLAGMVDLLCSALTGMGHGKTLAAFAGPDFARPIPLGHLFIVLSPGLFQALGAFEERVRAFVADLRAQPARPGETVRAPGDLEKAEAAERTRAGLPLDPTTWAALLAEADRRSIPLPPLL